MSAGKRLVAAVQVARERLAIRSAHGQAMGEYAMILAGVSVVAIMGVNRLDVLLTTLYQRIAASLS